jgi:DNA-binding MarR family transcriptional regulator
MPKPTKQQYARAARLREELLRFLHVSDVIAGRHGLTQQRYQLLLMIKTAREGTERAPLSELKERLQLANSTIVELVQRAEALGLVKRELSAQNRRLVYVALTEKGQKQLDSTLIELVRARKRLRASLATIAREA